MSGGPGSGSDDAFDRIFKRLERQEAEAEARKKRREEKRNAPDSSSSEDKDSSSSEDKDSSTNEDKDTSGSGLSENGDSDGSEWTECVNDEEHSSDLGCDYNEDEYYDDEVPGCLGYLIDQLMTDIDGVHLTGSAVYSLQSRKLWSMRGVIPLLTKDQFWAICDFLNDPSSLGSREFWLGDFRYNLVKSGLLTLHGTWGTGGCSFRTTLKTMIMGIYEEPMTSEQCKTVLWDVGSSFITSGF